MMKKNSKEETHGTMNTLLNDLEAKLPEVTGGPEISVRQSRLPSGQASPKGFSHTRLLSMGDGSHRLILH